MGEFPMAALDDVLIFVKVAQFESISRAARSLGMPISTVSRRLSMLESKLGVSLLRRTTRRVTLTGQGRDYFNQCREPLTLLEEAERVLTLGQKTPEGMLRISVPVILGREPFLDFLSGFLNANPRIRIDLFITNLFLDLVAENIDVAIRFGELQDSSLVATRIGKSIRYLVAATQYLKGRKLPVEPKDLKLHDCVMLNARNNETDWDLVYGRKKAHLRVPGSRDRTAAVNLLRRSTRKRCTHTAVAQVGFSANPRFCGVLESKIPSFEVEHLPGCPGSLEEPAVAQRMKGGSSHSA